MRSVTLDGRLNSVGKFVRQGAEFADIGTDHAYLPIYLLKSDRIKSAVASDINEGPLKSAKANAEEMGVSDRMRFVLTDGARGLEGFGLSDVAIAGMGGELIADIIEASPFLRDEKIRLILQPMSKQGHLRRYLAERGFDIISEDYSSSGGKFYVTLCAEYSGTTRKIDEYEAEFGKREFLLKLTSDARGYLEKKKKSFSRAANGKSASEKNPIEADLCAYIDAILKIGDWYDG